MALNNCCTSRRHAINRKKGGKYYSSACSITIENEHKRRRVFIISNYSSKSQPCSRSSMTENSPSDEVDWEFQQRFKLGRHRLLQHRKVPRWSGTFHLCLLIERQIHQNYKMFIMIIAVQHVDGRPVLSTCMDTEVQLTDFRITGDILKFSSLNSKHIIGTCCENC